MTTTWIILGGLIVFVLTVFAKTIRIVPNKEAFVIERLGKYRTTLKAGFHVLIPFIDVVAYKHTLKEVAMDIPSQECVTRDNITISVDGILYIQVIDPQKASYGIDDFVFAATQLAQTTMRSQMGKMLLDKTFEERGTINVSIVNAIDEAAEPWGVKVTRYELKNIIPPKSVKDSMEKFMKAEREKRANIAESEGLRDAEINKAEGDKQAIIAQSEAEKQKRINEAEGKASEITLVAEATALGIERIANSIQTAGGSEAVNLRIAEQYIKEFGNLAKETNSIIIPSNLSDISGMLATFSKVIQTNKTT